MYAGHAAIATLVKGQRPNLSLILLVPVAFGPDWIDIFSHVVHHPNPDVSHSLLSVVVCSMVVALCALRALGGADAAIVGATYASHWPADWITGVKSVWPNGPSFGLQLYAHAGADFVVESLLVVACWLVYRASLRPESRNSVLTYLLPLGLIALQAGFALVRAPMLT